VRQPAIRLGLVNQQGELAEATGIFASALQSRLGYLVKTIAARNDDHLLEGVCLGGIDLAWMRPSLHVRAEGGCLAAVSVRHGQVSYRSALLVRSDSLFETPNDLAGARVVWTSPGSASGCAIPRLHLQSWGLNLRRLRSEAFAGSARRALEAVLEGSADLCACCVREDAGRDSSRARLDLYRFLPEAAWRLRVLDITEAIPADGLVFAKHVDEALQAHVRDALLDLHEGAAGAHALRALLNADRLAPVTPEIALVMKRFRERLAQ
jgi:phosphonate transport system substrate-binding protein